MTLNQIIPPAPSFRKDLHENENRLPHFHPSCAKSEQEASMRPPWLTTTLEFPPIRLIPRTPLTSPIPGSLPIPTTGTETQEPDAPDTVTPSVSQKVAATQEPATHSVAETQEPAMAETQEQHG
jgi:hypothetical protein